MKRMKRDTEKWIMPSINATDLSDIPVSKQHSRELEKIQKTFDEAEKAGFEKGYHEGKTLIEQQKMLLQRLIHEFEKPLNNVESEVYDMLVTLVEKSIRFILRSEVQTDITKLKTVVEQMLQEVKDKKNDLEIYLNEQDLASLEQQDLLSQIDIPKALFKPSSELATGEIKIESDNMIYNATVQSCLEQLFDEES